MNPQACALWDRAPQAIETATEFSKKDPDASASRAYYAAFYAVSAYFESKGCAFTKHTAVETAVHRDLVKAGKLTPEIGAAFAQLARVRIAGDYGGEKHVSKHGAAEAVKAARSVLHAVRGIFEKPLADEPSRSDDSETGGGT